MDEVENQNINYVDNLVGFWIKDVPYYMIKKKDNKTKGRDWQNYSRVYVPRNRIELEIIKKFILNITFPSQKISPSGQKISPSGQKISPFGRCTNKNVISYFRFIESQDLSPDIDLRLNGYLIAFPFETRIFIKEKNILSYIPSEPINKIEIITKNKPIIPIKFPTIEIKSPSRLSKIKDDQKIQLFILLWYIRRLEKYENICTPLLYSEINFTHKIYHLVIFIYDINFNEYYLWYKAKAYFGLCLSVPNIRYIYIPISLQYKFLNKAHANLLVFDLAEKTMILLDPWGKGKFSSQVQIILPSILDFFGMDSQEWTIYNSDSICPPQSFQLLKGGKKILHGACRIWTLWLFELKLKNQSLTWPLLIRLAIKHIEKDFNLFIGQYNQVINEYGKGIASGLEIDPNYKGIPGEIRTSILEKISTYQSSLKRKIITKTDYPNIEKDSIVFNLENGYKLLKIRNMPMNLDIYRNLLSYLMKRDILLNYLPTFQLFLIYDNLDKLPKDIIVTKNITEIIDEYKGEIKIKKGKLSAKPVSPLNQLVADICQFIPHISLKEIRKVFPNLSK